jgi:hypothetical protein
MVNEKGLYIGYSPFLFLLPSHIGVGVSSMFFVVDVLTSV